MKLLVSALMVLAMVTPSFAVDVVGVWNFNDGTTNDTSGFGVAADGTLGGGAAIVADPLGTRGNVLYIANGGVMNTPLASESKFDSKTYTKISWWAYTPFAVAAGQGNDWWEMTIGKGYGGPVRSFVDSQAGLTVDYFFNYSDVVRSDNTVFNVSAAGWGDPKAKNSGWHFYEAAIWQNLIGTDVGFASATWTDGVLNGYADTQTALEFDVGGGLRVSNDTVQIGGNGWHGYIDDVTYTVPEPATMALLGLGALAAIRRKK